MTGSARPGGGTRAGWLGLGAIGALLLALGSRSRRDEVDGPGGRTALIVGVVLAVPGLLLFALGLLLDARQALLSYLAAYATGLSIVLGALILVMTCNITGARWFDAFRRPAEAIAASSPLFAVLFLPLAFGLSRVYPWAPAAAGDRRVWLNEPSFLIRAAIYFAVWIAAGLLLRRWSLRPGAGARGRVDSRSRALSAGGLPAVAFTFSFAAFDWLMSLSPAWFSTIYGVYVFAGGFLAALAVLALLEPGRAPRADNYQKLGNLLLTFTVFWAYIAFSQFLIIWIADVPQEVAWYAPRVRGSWGALALVVLAGQFALPFFVLLLRRVKRSPGTLAKVGAWLLVMHYLDVYWLVLPQLDPGGVRPHWLDLAALCAIGGCTMAYAAWLLGRAALVPAARSHRR
ncbi:MAG TPA: hypothetical protein VHL81_12465 [Gemmatimonadales bacterium]|nr:hypothetical protein [Gemmatimonadales bacterium]